MNSTKIYLSAPDVGELEAQAVSNAVRSGWVAPLGPEVDAFEEEMRIYTGASHTLALSSGTAALHLSLLAIGVTPGDVVIVPTMTFAATVNAVLYCGAIPHFVDCDYETGNIDVHLLEHALAEATSKGHRVTALISVDMLGKIVDIEGIQRFCKAHGIPWISDSAESVGSVRAGTKSGNFSDISVFSFNGNKVMTTSGGGMLLSSDKDLVAKARHLSTQARVPAVHYEHDEIGYNYRMSNILAALGRVQLSRLDSMISRRRSIRKRYTERLSELLGVEFFGQTDDQGDNCWLTAILVGHPLERLSPTGINSYMNSLNIETRPLWKPMHLQPVFKKYGSTLNGNSDLLFQKGIVLPSGSGMSDEMVEFVCDSLDKIMKPISG